MYEFINFIFSMGKKYKVIGIMSGTSLDGLDIAYCEFVKGKNWKYNILHAETKKYNKEWKAKLSEAFRMNKNDLKQFDKEFGKFIGSEVSNFIRRKKITVDFIASHGHTVFHQPEKKITRQIGDGAVIAAICKLPVVCDFRSGDVALGGQGAPLVPIADKLLFPQYDFCLNLGGFANISYDEFPLSPALASRLVGTGGGAVRYAFDICPVNIVLNELAKKFGKEFDTGGKMASQGKIDHALLNKLNKLPFYKMKPPKSLGREWVEKVFLPALNSYNASIHDKLRTVVEHIAIQISVIINESDPQGFLRKGSLTGKPSHNLSGRNRKYLITGGGSYNHCLMKRMAAHAKSKIVVTDDGTIQFKEAMAFAFLGVLRMRKEINILKSVTGAARDSSGGKIYFPDQNVFSSL